MPDLQHWKMDCEVTKIRFGHAGKTRLRERRAHEHQIRAERTRAEPVPGCPARVWRQQHHACTGSLGVTLERSDKSTVGLKVMPSAA